MRGVIPGGVNFARMLQAKSGRKGEAGRNYPTVGRSYKVAAEMSGPFEKQFEHGEKAE